MLIVLDCLHLLADTLWNENGHVRNFIEDLRQVILHFLFVNFAQSLSSICLGLHVDVALLGFEFRVFDWFDGVSNHVTELSWSW